MQTKTTQHYRFILADDDKYLVYQQVQNHGGIHYEVSWTTDPFCASQFASRRELNREHRNKFKELWLTVTRHVEIGI